MASTSVKCKIPNCTRLVGPLRQKVSDLCYVCDRNIEDWSARGSVRRLEWNRRVRMFVERQDVLPKGVSDSDVAAYVRKIVTAAMRKKGTK